MLKILFRTACGAGKNNIGFGHIMRCKNLGEYLKKIQSYYIVEDFGGSKKFLQSQKIKNFRIISKKIKLEKDIEETKKIIDEKDIDIIIVDRYKISKLYIKKIKKIITTIVISDLDSIEFSSDLVINGFIGYDNMIRKNKFGSKCLLGPKFQILNKKFLHTLHNKEKRYDILISMGGSDENQVIENLMTKLGKYNFYSRIILGPGTIKNKKIQKLEKLFPKKFSVIQQTNNMKAEIAGAKYGICSGGLTSYEYAAMGLPFAIICQVPHQQKTAIEWERRGIALNLGLGGKNSRKVDIFLNELNDKKMYSFKHRPLDGKGLSRVGKEISKILKKTR